MTSENLLREVNGVIWPGFLGSSVPDWLNDALSDGLAGVVYFRQNIESAEQLKDLSAQIRTLNPSAIIGVDEEGGNVTRLQTEHGSQLPGAAVLGRLDELAVTEAAGAAIGRLCRQSGINLAIAPVADVNTNPANPVIGVRSFGADTDLVARHTAAMVRGIQKTGIAACAKHFPGHGDTHTDSHLGLPRLEFDVTQLREQHLPPFQAASEAGVEAVMTAHIVLADLGEEPATTNSSTLQMLRESGFDGVIITDALDMAAIRETVGSGAGAVKAILAGADLLCVGNPANPRASADPEPDRTDYLEVRDALLAAVQSGALPRERLRAAYQRNQSLATRIALAKENPNSVNNSTEDPDWVDVAESVLWSDAPLPESLFAAKRISLRDLRGDQNLAIGAAGSFFHTAFAEYFELVETDVPNVVIADSLENGTKQWRELSRLAALNPELVCLNAGLRPVQTPPAITVTTFGSSQISAQAAARYFQKSAVPLP